MSGSLEDWLRATTDAWNCGDREEYVRITPPDWEFHTSGVFPGLKPVYRGPDGAGELWDAMQGPWETFTVTVERGREGIPTRTDNFATWAAALEAAGLRE